MTNTIMLAGTRSRRDPGVGEGRTLAHVNFGGGQVDITSGKFVFSAAEAWKIENGSRSAPWVKGAPHGQRSRCADHVSMGGRDLGDGRRVAPGGKDGQSVQSALWPADAKNRRALTVRARTG
jgi:TldD protein